MTRLVLLNGTPGVGKSTLARRWADDRPGTLVCDTDAANLDALVSDRPGTVAVASVEGDEDATYDALAHALR